MADINNLKKRKEWIEKANCVELEIIDRKSKYIGQELNCELTLKFPETLVDTPSEQIVKVKVSANIYYNYNGQNTICIYSSKSDPYCFLIDGE